MKYRLLPNLKLSIADAKTLFLFIFFSFITVYFYSEIYTQLYGLIFAAFIVLPIMIKVRKILLPAGLIKILFFFLLFISYIYLNETKELIYTWEEYIIPLSSAYLTIIQSVIIILLMFISGYLYSFAHKDSFKIISKVLFIQVILFIINVLLNFKNIQYSLELGIWIIFCLPYMLIAFKFEKLKMDVLIFLTLFTFLFLISNRGALIALVVFIINYSLYPIYCKKINLYRAVFFINIISIIILLFLYIKYFDNEWLNNLSVEFFDKAFNSGRGNRWIQLLIIINDQFLFGYGNAQRSVYFVSDLFTWTTISSENLFLELILISGLVGLFLFLILIYTIWINLWSNNNYYGRIASSSLMSALFLSSTSEIMISQNIIHNTLFWIFLGAAIGQVFKSKLITDNK